MLVVVSVSHDKRQNIKKYENKGPKRPGALQLLVRPQLNHAVIISAELWEREHARVGGMGGACVNAQMEGRCFVLRYQDGIAYATNDTSTWIKLTLTFKPGVCAKYASGDCEW